MSFDTATFVSFLFSMTFLMLCCFSMMLYGHRVAGWIVGKLLQWFFLPKGCKLSIGGLLVSPIGQRVFFKDVSFVHPAAGVSMRCVDGHVTWDLRGHPIFSGGYAPLRPSMLENDCLKEAAVDVYAAGHWRRGTIIDVERVVSSTATPTAGGGGSASSVDMSNGTASHVTHRVVVRLDHIMHDNGKSSDSIPSELDGDVESDSAGGSGPGRATIAVLLDPTHAAQPQGSTASETGNGRFATAVEVVVSPSHVRIHIRPQRLRLHVTGLGAALFGNPGRYARLEQVLREWMPQEMANAGLGAASAAASSPPPPPPGGNAKAQTAEALDNIRAEQHERDAAYERFMKFIGSFDVTLFASHIDLGALEASHPYFLRFAFQKADVSYLLTQAQTDYADAHRHVVECSFEDVSLLWAHQSINSKNREGRAAYALWKQQQRSKVSRLRLFKERARLMFQGVAADPMNLRSGDEVEKEARTAEVNRSGPGVDEGGVIGADRSDHYHKTNSAEAREDALPRDDAITMAASMSDSVMHHASASASTSTDTATFMMGASFPVRTATSPLLGLSLTNDSSANIVPGSHDVDVDLLEAPSELLRQYGTIISRQPEPNKRAAAIRAIYYWDAPGIHVEADQPDDDSLPKSGLDIELCVPTICYGPWSNYSRAQLQLHFFPPTFVDVPVVPQAVRGKPRPVQGMEVSVRFCDPCTIVVPFKVMAPVPVPPNGIRDSGQSATATIEVGAGSYYHFKPATARPGAPSTKPAAPTHTQNCGPPSIGESFAQLQECSIYTSMFGEAKSLCLRSSAMRVHYDTLYPPWWFACNEVNTIVQMENAELHYSQEHAAFFTMLINDWNYVPQMYAGAPFVPSQLYNRETMIDRFVPNLTLFEVFVERGLRVHLSANPDNVMLPSARADRVDQNHVVTLAADGGMIRYQIPNDVYLCDDVNEQKHVFDVQLRCVAIEATVPSDHEMAAFNSVAQDNPAVLDMMQLDGSYVVRTPDMPKFGSEALSKAKAVNSTTGIDSNGNNDNNRKSINPPLVNQLRLAIHLHGLHGAVTGLLVTHLQHAWGNLFGDTPIVISPDDYHSVTTKLPPGNRAAMLQQFLARHEPRRNETELSVTVALRDIDVALAVVSSCATDPSDGFDLDEFFEGFDRPATGRAAQRGRFGELRIATHAVDVSVSSQMSFSEVSVAVTPIRVVWLPPTTAPPSFGPKRHGVRRRGTSPTQNGIELSPASTDTTVRAFSPSHSRAGPRKSSVSVHGAAPAPPLMNGVSARYAAEGGGLSSDFSAASWYDTAAISPICAVDGLRFGIASHFGPPPLGVKFHSVTDCHVGSVSVHLPVDDVARIAATVHRWVRHTKCKDAARDAEMARARARADVTAADGFTWTGGVSGDGTSPPSPPLQGSTAADGSASVSSHPHHLHSSGFPRSRSVAGSATISKGASVAARSGVVGPAARANGPSAARWSRGGRSSSGGGSGSRYHCALLQLPHATREAFELDLELRQQAMDESVDLGIFVVRASAAHLSCNIVFPHMGVFQLQLDHGGNLNSSTLNDTNSNKRLSVVAPDCTMRVLIPRGLSGTSDAQQRLRVSETVGDFIEAMVLQATVCMRHAITYPYGGGSGAGLGGTAAPSTTDTDPMGGGLMGGGAAGYRTTGFASVSAALGGVGMPSGSGSAHQNVLGHFMRQAEYVRVCDYHGLLNFSYDAIFPRTLTSVTASRLHQRQRRMTTVAPSVSVGDEAAQPTARTSYLDETLSPFTPASHTATAAGPGERRSTIGARDMASPTHAPTAYRVVPDSWVEPEAGSTRLNAKDISTMAPLAPSTFSAAISRLDAIDSVYKPFVAFDEGNQQEESDDEVRAPKRAQSWRAALAGKQAATVVQQRPPTVAPPVGSADAQDFDHLSSSSKSSSLMHTQDAQLHEKDPTDAISAVGSNAFHTCISDLSGVARDATENLTDLFSTSSSSSAAALDHNIRSPSQFSSSEEHRNPSEVHTPLAPSPSSLFSSSRLQPGVGGGSGSAAHRPQLSYFRCLRSFDVSASFQHGFGNYSTTNTLPAAMLHRVDARHATRDPSYYHAHIPFVHFVIHETSLDPLEEPSTQGGGSVAQDASAPQPSAFDAAIDFDAAAGGGDENRDPGWDNDIPDRAFEWCERGVENVRRSRDGSTTRHVHVELPKAVKVLLTNEGVVALAAMLDMGREEWLWASQSYEEAGRVNDVGAASPLPARPRGSVVVDDPATAQQQPQQTRTAAATKKKSRVKSRSRTRVRVKQWSVKEDIVSIAVPCVEVKWLARLPVPDFVAPVATPPTPEHPQGLYTSTLVLREFHAVTQRTSPPQRLKAVGAVRYGASLRVSTVAVFTQVNYEPLVRVGTLGVEVPFVSYPHRADHIVVAYIANLKARGKRDFVGETQEGSVFRVTLDSSSWHATKDAIHFLPTAAASVQQAWSERHSFGGEARMRSSSMSREDGASPLRSSAAGAASPTGRGKGLFFVDPRAAHGGGDAADDTDTNSDEDEEASQPSQPTHAQQGLARGRHTQPLAAEGQPASRGQPAVGGRMGGATTTTTPPPPVTPTTVAAQLHSLIPANVLWQVQGTLSVRNSLRLELVDVQRTRSSVNVLVDQSCSLHLVRPVISAKFTTPVGGALGSAPVAPVQYGAASAAAQSRRANRGYATIAVGPAASAQVMSVETLVDLQQLALYITPSMPHLVGAAVSQCQQKRSSHEDDSAAPASPSSTPSSPSDINKSVKRYAPPVVLTMTLSIRRVDCKVLQGPSNYVQLAGRQWTLCIRTYDRELVAPLCAPTHQRKSLSRDSQPSLAAPPPITTGGEGGGVRLSPQEVKNLRNSFSKRVLMILCKKALQQRQKFYRRVHAPTTTGRLRLRGSMSLFADAITVQYVAELCGEDSVVAKAKQPTQQQGGEQPHVPPSPPPSVSVRDRDTVVSGDTGSVVSFTIQRLAASFQVCVHHDRVEVVQPIVFVGVQSVALKVPYRPQIVDVVHPQLHALVSEWYRSIATASPLWSSTTIATNKAPEVSPSETHESTKPQDARFALVVHVDVRRVEVIVGLPLAASVRIDIPQVTGALRTRGQRTLLKLRVFPFALSAKTPSTTASRYPSSTTIAFPAVVVEAGRDADKANATLLMENFEAVVDPQLMNHMLLTYEKLVTDLLAVVTNGGNEETDTAPSHVEGPISPGLSPRGAAEGNGVVMTASTRPLRSFMTVAVRGVRVSLLSHMVESRCVVSKLDIIHEQVANAPRREAGATLSSGAAIFFPSEIVTMVTSDTVVRCDGLKLAMVDRDDRNQQVAFAMSQHTSGPSAPQPNHASSFVAAAGGALSGSTLNSRTAATAGLRPMQTLPSVPPAPSASGRSTHSANPWGGAGTRLSGYIWGTGDVSFEVKAHQITHYRRPVQIPSGGSFLTSPSTVKSTMSSASTSTAFAAHRPGDDADRTTIEVALSTPVVVLRPGFPQHLRLVLLEINRTVAGTKRQVVAESIELRAKLRQSKAYRKLVATHAVRVEAVNPKQDKREPPPAMTSVSAAAPTAHNNIPLHVAGSAAANQGKGASIKLRRKPKLQLDPSVLHQQSSTAPLPSHNASTTSLSAGGVGAVSRLVVAIGVTNIHIIVPCGDAAFRGIVEGQSDMYEKGRVGSSASLLRHRVVPPMALRLHIASMRLHGSRVSEAAHVVAPSNAHEVGSRRSGSSKGGITRLQSAQLDVRPLSLSSHLEPPVIALESVLSRTSNGQVTIDGIHVFISDGSVLPSTLQQQVQLLTAQRSSVVLGGIGYLTETAPGDVERERDRSYDRVQLDRVECNVSVSEAKAYQHMIPESIRSDVMCALLMMGSASGVTSDSIVDVVDAATRRKLGGWQPLAADHDAPNYNGGEGRPTAAGGGVSTIKSKPPMRCSASLAVSGPLLLVTSRCTAMLSALTEDFAVSDAQFVDLYTNASASPFPDTAPSSDGRHARAGRWTAPTGSVLRATGAPIEPRLYVVDIQATLNPGRLMLFSWSGGGAVATHGSVHEQRDTALDTNPSSSNGRRHKSTDPSPDAQATQGTLPTQGLRRQVSFSFANNAHSTLGQPRRSQAASDRSKYVATQVMEMPLPSALFVATASGAIGAQPAEVTARVSIQARRMELDPAIAVLWQEVQLWTHANHIQSRDRALSTVALVEDMNRVSRAQASSSGGRARATLAAFVAGLHTSIMDTVLPVPKVFVAELAAIRSRVDKALSGGGSVAPPPAPPATSKRGAGTGANRPASSTTQLSLHVSLTGLRLDFSTVSARTPSHNRASSGRVPFGSGAASLPPFSALNSSNASRGSNTLSNTFVAVFVDDDGSIDFLLQSSSSPAGGPGPTVHAAVTARGLRVECQNRVEVKSLEMYLPEVIAHVSVRAHSLPSSVGSHTDAPPPPPLPSDPSTAMMMVPVTTVVVHVPGGGAESDGTAPNSAGGLGGAAVGSIPMLSSGAQNGPQLTVRLQHINQLLLVGLHWLQEWEAARQQALHLFRSTPSSATVTTSVRATESPGLRTSTLDAAGGKAPKHRRRGLSTLVQKALPLEATFTLNNMSIAQYLSHPTAMGDQSPESPSDVDADATPEGADAEGVPEHSLSGDGFMPRLPPSSGVTSTAVFPTSVSHVVVLVGRSNSFLDLGGGNKHEFGIGSMRFAGKQVVYNSLQSLVSGDVDLRAARICSNGVLSGANTIAAVRGKGFAIQEPTEDDLWFALATSEAVDPCASALLFDEDGPLFTNATAAAAADSGEGGHHHDGAFTPHPAMPHPRLKLRLPKPMVTPEGRTKRLWMQLEDLNMHFKERQIRDVALFSIDALSFDARDSLETEEPADKKHSAERQPAAALVSVEAQRCLAGITPQTSAAFLTVVSDITHILSEQQRIARNNLSLLLAAQDLRGSVTHASTQSQPLSAGAAVPPRHPSSSRDNISAAVQAAPPSTITSSITDTRLSRHIASGQVSLRLTHTTVMLGSVIDVRSLRGDLSLGTAHYDHVTLHVPSMTVDFAQLVTAASDACESEVVVLPSDSSTVNRSCIFSSASGDEGRGVGGGGGSARLPSSANSDVGHSHRFASKASAVKQFLASHLRFLPFRKGQPHIDPVDSTSFLPFSTAGSATPATPSRPLFQDKDSSSTRTGVALSPLSRDGRVSPPTAAATPSASPPAALGRHKVAVQRGTVRKFVVMSVDHVELTRQQGENRITILALRGTNHMEFYAQEAVALVAPTITSRVASSVTIWPAQVFVQREPPRLPWELIGDRLVSYTLQLRQTHPWTGSPKLEDFHAMSEVLQSFTNPQNADAWLDDFAAVRRSLYNHRPPAVPNASAVGQPSQQPATATAAAADTTATETSSSMLSMSPRVPGPEPLPPLAGVSLRFTPLDRSRCRFAPQLRFGRGDMSVSLQTILSWLGTREEMIPELLHNFVCSTLEDLLAAVDSCSSISRALGNASQQQQQQQEHPAVLQ